MRGKINTLDVDLEIVLTVELGRDFRSAIGGGGRRHISFEYPAIFRRVLHRYYMCFCG